MRPELVIFDCDGVLVDSEGATNEVIAANLTRHGLAISAAECQALFVGGTMRSVMAESQRRGGTLPKNWLDEIYAEMFARLRRGVPVIAGVTDLIDQLDTAGIASCIVSNGPMAKMEISLGADGLFERFEGRIYSAYDYLPKPDPAMLLAALGDFGVAPNAAVMIDDSAAGCLAARNAGVRCLGYAATGDGRDLEQAGAEVISSITEVAGRIGLG